jgi:inner membrane protein
LEPVTHFLTGACLGRAGLNRTTALATLTLTLAAEAPDLDVVFYAGGSVTGFAHHRGFTHSFLGAPIVAAVVVAGVYGIYRWMLARGRPTRTLPNWKLLYAYAILANFVHIFQDYTNNYGVRPFWPVSERWYSWDIVFILDPVMLLAMFAALVGPGILALISEEVGERRPAFRGRGAAIAALVCVAGLIFVRGIEHRRAITALDQSFLLERTGGDPRLLPDDAGEFPRRRGRSPRRGICPLQAGRNSSHAGGKKIASRAGLPRLGRVPRGGS